jgi:hypothetical protein
MGMFSEAFEDNPFSTRPRHSRPEPMKPAQLPKVGIPADFAEDPGYIAAKAAAQIRADQTGGKIELWYDGSYSATQQWCSSWVGTVHPAAK